LADFCDPKGHHELPDSEGCGGARLVLEVRVPVLVEVVLRADDEVVLDVVVLVVLSEVDVVFVEVVKVDVVDLDVLVVLVLDEVVVKGLPIGASAEQSVNEHRSLQSLIHMSVQFIVPVGHPQSQRSWFARLNDHAPIRVPTASA
jgi:hypothetical protein